MVHGLCCAASFALVGVLTLALAAWTSVGARGLTAIVVIGVGACGAYGYYLLRRYRIPCPDCEFAGARFARDTQGRQLLVCPECGLRAATGRRVLADSPVGH
jgi:hypothetical protein